MNRFLTGGPSGFGESSPGFWSAKEECKLAPSPNVTLCHLRKYKWAPASIPKPGPGVSGPVKPCRAASVSLRLKGTNEPRRSTTNRSSGSFGCALTDSGRPKAHSEIIAAANAYRAMIDERTESKSIRRWPEIFLLRRRGCHF